VIPRAGLGHRSSHAGGFLLYIVAFSLLRFDTLRRGITEAALGARGRGVGEGGPGNGMPGPFA
jgi:hypothetical protein